MARTPGGGLLGRLLSGVRGRPAREGTSQTTEDRDRREAAERLEAAHQRLKDAIPPPEAEEPDPRAP